MGKEGCERKAEKEYVERAPQTPSEHQPAGVDVKLPKFGD
jgi:hypothetical protein